MRHRFFAGGGGIDRCACGTERELRGDPGQPFWWYRLMGQTANWIAFGLKNCTRTEGREDWPCPLGVEQAA